MAPIKIVNPVYSGQQGHAAIGQNKVEDQIKIPIPVNEEYGTPGVKLQGSVTRPGGRITAEVENYKLVHRVGYVLPGGAHYGGIPQTGLVHQRGPVLGQIPPRFGLGVQKMEYPEQWYRNSTSSLPDPAKIKKEIEAMMASFGLKAFSDAPSATTATPTPPLNTAPVSNEGPIFYQEYSGGSHPKRARPNPKIEASPHPRDQNAPSQQNYTSSVPHLQVSLPLQRDARHIPPRQVSSSYEQINPPQQQDPLQQSETPSYTLQVSPSQQVYISPPSQEYITASPQEYVIASPQEYVTPSPQEYVTPSPQEYVNPSPQEYVTPSSQEYVTPSPQEYVNPLSQEYLDDQSPSQHGVQSEESSL